MFRAICSELVHRWLRKYVYCTYRLHGTTVQSKEIRIIAQVAYQDQLSNSV